MSDEIKSDPSQLCFVHTHLGNIFVQVPAADIPDTLPLANNVAQKQPFQATETTTTEDSEARLVRRIRDKLLKSSKGSDRFAFSQSHPCMQHLNHHLTSFRLKNFIWKISQLKCVQRALRKVRHFHILRFLLSYIFPQGMMHQKSKSSKVLVEIAVFRGWGLNTGGCQTGRQGNYTSRNHTTLGSNDAFFPERWRRAGLGQAWVGSGNKWTF